MRVLGQMKRILAVAAHAIHAHRLHTSTHTHTRTRTHTCTYMHASNRQTDMNTQSKHLISHHRDT
jgi:hypothetical protein